MGFFSFLKSVKVTYTDKVCKTRPVAVKGMVTEALMAIKQNRMPVVFCYFEDTLNEVIAFLTTAGVPYFHLNHDSIREASNQNNVIFMCDASLILTSSGLMGLLSSFSSKNGSLFLFAGHYPLPTKENKIIEKLSSSFPEAEIKFCSSIDDPAFQPFGADRISNLLDQLGLKADECIEHAMVSKAMARAREKIESKVQHEVFTRSEAEWFLNNLKK